MSSHGKLALDLFCHFISCPYIQELYSGLTEGKYLDLVEGVNLENPAVQRDIHLKMFYMTTVCQHLSYCSLKINNDRKWEETIFNGDPLTSLYGFRTFNSFNNIMTNLLDNKYPSFTPLELTGESSRFEFFFQIKSIYEFLYHLNKDLENIWKIDSIEEFRLNLDILKFHRFHHSRMHIVHQPPLEDYHYLEIDEQLSNPKDFELILCLYNKLFRCQSFRYYLYSMGDKIEHGLRRSVDYSIDEQQTLLVCLIKIILVVGELLEIVGTQISRDSERFSLWKNIWNQLYQRVCIDINAITNEIMPGNCPGYDIDVLNYETPIEDVRIQMGVIKYNLLFLFHKYEAKMSGKIL